MKDEEILRLIELLSEETRQTKKLVNAAEKTAHAAQQSADAAAMKRADAAWKDCPQPNPGHFRQVEPPLATVARWKKLLG